MSKASAPAALMPEPSLMDLGKMYLEIVDSVILEELFDVSRFIFYFV